MTRVSFLPRIGVLLYGFVAYAIGFATLCYTAGFLGNFLVPRSIDSAPTLPFGLALLVDASLLALFAVQHSLMARPFFKRWLTRFIPAAAERSTYLVASSLALALLFCFWQPLGGVVWEIHHSLARGMLYGGFALGWLLLFASTFHLNHFDLFGLRQVWLHFRSRPYTALPFKTPGLYKFVRHPLYVGWFLTLWCTPTMSATHLFFAFVTTIYILIAIQLEERDLQNFHPEYADYKRTTPMLVPRLGDQTPGESRSV